MCVSIEGIPCFNGSDHRHLGVFTGIEFYGHLVLQQVSCRIRAYVAAAFNNLIQVTQAGGAVVVLRSHGGTLSEIVGICSTGLSVGHILVLHDDIAIFVKYHLKVESRRSAGTGHKSQVAPLYYRISVGGCAKSLEINVSSSFGGNQVIPENGDQRRHSGITGYRLMIIENVAVIIPAVVGEWFHPVVTGQQQGAVDVGVEEGAVYSIIGEIESYGNGFREVVIAGKGIYPVRYRRGAGSTDIYPVVNRTSGFATVDPPVPHCIRATGSVMLHGIECRHHRIVG